MLNCWDSGFYYFPLMCAISFVLEGNSLIGICEDEIVLELD